MTVERAILAAAVAAMIASPASAAPAFTCTAKGDSWSVSGGPGRAATCSVTCLLSDQQGDHDRVVCAAKVSGSTKDGVVCEGEQLGRHWTGAEVLLSQCSYDQP